MRYDDIEYNECDEVYPPAEDTFLFIDNLEVKEDDKVLEIGIGTGIVSIKAAMSAKEVVGVDINKHAIKCAQENVKLNNIKNTTIIESDLFENIKEKFDLILFNTPYLPVTDDEHLDDDDYSKAWDGGADGRSVIDRFLKDAKKYLKDNGRIQLIQSSLSNNEKTLKYLNENGYVASIGAVEHQFFEDITLINAKLI